MDKRSYLILITVFLVSVLLGGCGGYKPPYDRGYEAGYAAGVAAAGGSVSEGAVGDTAPAKSALTSMTSKTEDEASEEVSEASSEEAGTERFRAVRCWARDRSFPVRRRAAAGYRMAV